MAFGDPDFELEARAETAKAERAVFRPQILFRPLDFNDVSTSSESILSSDGSFWEKHEIGDDTNGDEASSPERNKKKESLNSYYKSHPYLCLYCRQRFILPKGLKRCFDTHTDEELASVNITRDGTIDKGKLDTPKKKSRKTPKVSAKNGPPISCKICGRIYKEVSFLRKHYKKYHPHVAEGEEFEKKFQELLTCSLCHKTFANAARKNKHMKCVHAKYLRRNNIEKYLISTKSFLSA